MIVIVSFSLKIIHQYIDIVMKYVDVKVSEFAPSQPIIILRMLT